MHDTILNGNTTPTQATAKRLLGPKNGMRGLAILLGFQALGLLFHRCGVPLPPNVLGLLLLTLALFCGWVKVETVEATADFLLRHMMLFFAPLVVGVVAVWPLFAHQAVPIAGGLLGGVVTVLLVSSWTATRLGAAATGEKANGKAGAVLENR